MQDWHNYISQNPTLTLKDLLDLRVACYKRIESIRKRPLIVYASNFLDGNPAFPCDINLNDIDGFTDLVNNVEGNKVDVLIHSPGGSPDATERIVSILRTKFTEVNFLIPHSAYSAATMLALSGDSIILHPSATLGPIDPQLNGIPARSMKRGFDNAIKIIIEKGPEALPAYMPLIEKYTLAQLELCVDSESLSKELVSTWLKQYMFKAVDAQKRAIYIRKIVNFFSNYDKQLLHSRPLVYNKLKGLNLNIEIADGELKDLLWESYILIKGFFCGSRFFKIYESAYGISWGPQFNPMPIPPQQAMQPQSVTQGIR